MSEQTNERPTPLSGPDAPHQEGHRSFDIRRRNTDGKPRTFDLNGQVFTYYPDRLPEMVLIDLPGMAVHANSEPMWALFQSVMPEDFTRFKRLVRNPSLLFDAADLKALIELITEESTERPTRRPSS